MKEREFDLVVYIGRFQPFHDAHAATINHAAQIANHVLTLIGSSHSPRSIKNPWSYDERKQMIMNSLYLLSIGIRGIRDYTYDDNAWITEVGETVNNYAKEVGAKKIAIIGHDKDHSSFYLNYFPQWTFIPQLSYPDHGGDSIDATKIRKLIFNGDVEFVKSVIPDNVYEFLVRGYPEFNAWLKSPMYHELKAEWDYIEDYNRAWASAPYPPTFVTVDSLVIQSGHILLVERGGFPGKGLLALPGGFLDPLETIRHAAVRELREETGLKVPEKVLDGSIDAYEMFDAIGRSTRGRTITHAYRFTLDSSQTLPRVRGSSDAAKAMWYSFAEVENMEALLMEDHYHIIKHLLRLPSGQVRR